MNQPTKIEIRKIYVGIRKISNQNFSKIIAIPKTALMNCGNPSHFEVYVVLEDDRQSVMLVPVRKKDS